MNQCDGCKQGLPIKDGLHYKDGHPWIGCTSELYEGPMQYSNPTTFLERDDWPLGGRGKFLRRGKCRFWIEQHTIKKTGVTEERVCRMTETKPGVWAKPKTTTYAAKCAIVEGEDGKIYVLSHSASFRMISVTQSDMKFSAETIHDSDQRYEEVVQLIANRQGPEIPSV